MCEKEKKILPSLTYKKSNFRGCFFAKMLRILSVSILFSRRGCRDILARWSILSWVIELLLSVRSRFNVEKLRSPSFEVIGWVRTICSNFLVSFSMGFTSLYRSRTPFPFWSCMKVKFNMYNMCIEYCMFHVQLSKKVIKTKESQHCGSGFWPNSDGSVALSQTRYDL